MSSVKIALLGSACLLATVSLANADEIKLSTDQLDFVTAGAVGEVPRIGGPQDAGFTFFGPANPEPEPEPEPPAPNTPSVPNLPNLPGGFGGLQSFIQQLIGNFNLPGLG